MASGNRTSYYIESCSLTVRPLICHATFPANSKDQRNLNTKARGASLSFRQIATFLCFKNSYKKKQHYQATFVQFQTESRSARQNA